MKENYKIEKELLFKNNIKEITSISLDSDYKIEKNELVGNFIINGDYKIHEVSINREKFNFKIPFKHNIMSDIDENSVNLEITDFSYDYNKDDLMVNIEYEIVGDRKDILIFDNEETLDEFLNKREVEVIDTRINSIKEQIDMDNKDVITKSNLNNEERVKVILPIEKENESEVVCEETENDVCYKKLVINNEKNNTISEQLEDRYNTEVNVDINAVKDNEINMKTEEIINNTSTIQDKFITYKIYKVEDNDTLEGIVLKYHTSIDEIKEYNELNNISVGDKIIIPINE